MRRGCRPPPPGQGTARSQPKVDSFLEPPTADGTRDYHPSPEAQAVGTVVVGKYALAEVIGEGGMGPVWRAKQTEPVKRFVALKLIKPGMDSRQVLARFDTERQALAMMDHPNIVKILDGGIHDHRPFFVMELVKGTPITEFCDVRKLTAQQRLELFVPVCHAIQHAHMKKIIHRDIKPSNVLIALYDDKPVPKVIDFGVAKATGGALTQHTIDTGFGGVVGTPQYMSPEQATFNNLDIDTRSDVYSLGTLLYELLAGSPPFSRPELEKRGLLEILRVVREEEPPRPSTKLSTADAKASISANRGSEPAKLSALMKGEIDWIVMRALEKDRTRRYESANGFAADVQRYLAGEQVQAVPPSLGYRLRKAYRRNRAAVLIGAAFTLMLLTGAAISSWLAVKATRAEEMAEAKRIEAEDQRQEAERNMDAFSKTSEAYWDAAVEAEIRSASGRLDADLLEYKADPRVGLLRLARPLKDSVTIPIVGPNFSGTNLMTFKKNPEFVKLREFQTAAVLTTGQFYAPLLQPLTHDGQTVLRNEQSPDGKSVLTRGLDGTARLWDVQSAKQISILREDMERVVDIVFSPDGKTIFTNDYDSIVRFWSASKVQLLSKTALCKNRTLYPPQDSQERIIQLAKTNKIVLVESTALVQFAQLVLNVEKNALGKTSDGLENTQWKFGNNELINLESGRIIARLDRPGHTFENCKLSPDGRWFTAIEDDKDLIVFSAIDGKIIGRVVHKAPLRSARVSPNGRWIFTYAPEQLRLWSTETWSEISDRFFADFDTRWDLNFLTDDVLHATLAMAEVGTRASCIASVILIPKQVATGIPFRLSLAEQFFSMIIID